MYIYYCRFEKLISEQKLEREYLTKRERIYQLRIICVTLFLFSNKIGKGKVEVRHEKIEYISKVKLTETTNY